MARLAAAVEPVRHAVEHQADTEAGGQQHAQPGKHPVVRLAVLGAEPDFPVAAHRQRQQEDHEHEGADQIEPAEVVPESIEGGLGHVPEAVGGGGADGHQDGHQAGGDEINAVSYKHPRSLAGAQATATPGGPAVQKLYISPPVQGWTGNIQRLYSFYSSGDE